MQLLIFSLFVPLFFAKLFPIEHSHSDYPTIRAIQVAYSRGEVSNRFKDVNELSCWSLLEFAEEWECFRHSFKAISNRPREFEKLRIKFQVPQVNFTDMMMLTTAGRSKSRFFITNDGEFFLKSIPREESETLLEILPAYLKHVEENWQTTLLVPIIASLEIVHGNGEWEFSVLMKSAFPGKFNLDSHSLDKLYDLKGATVRRKANAITLAENEGKALLDVNWLDNHEKIDIGVKASIELKKSLKKDLAFLMKNNLVDYSFLVGVKNSEAEADSVLNGNSNNEMSRFNVENTGIVNSIQPPQSVFYFGIVDYLTPYDFARRVEVFYKTLREGRGKTSVQAPEFYAERLEKFVESQLVG